MSASYAIEPELLTPPPRRVISRKKPVISLGVGLFLIVAFLLPLCLCGLALIRTTMFRLHVQDFGGQTTGQITRVEDPNSDSTSEVYYTFRVGKEKYESHDSGNVQPFGLKPGGPITVNYLSDDPKCSELPLLSQSFPVSALVGVTLVVNGIVCIIVYVSFFVPRMERWLYRWGETAEGKITDKTEKITPADSDSPAQSHCTVHYAFTPDTPESSKPILNLAHVTEEQYKTVEIGDPLTILYNPRKPQRNLSYHLGDYKVV